MTRERGSSMLRVLDILEQVARSNTPVTLTELKDLLGMPKSTTHRLCNVLERNGYLQKNLDGKRYIPGSRLQQLAVGILGHFQLKVQRHAILTELSRDIGETCNLSHPDGAEMVYADRAETQWPLRLQLPIGTRVPLHCTASGKMYLSSLSKAKRQSLVSHLPIKTHTPNTVTDHDLLMRNLADIRKQNVSVDREEYVEGMIAVAVPIRDRNGTLYSTVSYHAPVARMDLTTALQYAPRLHQAAKDLSQLIEE